MERAYAELGRNNATLSSDKGMRLKERPQSFPSTNGFEDFGSDFIRANSAGGAEGVGGSRKSKNKNKNARNNFAGITAKKPKPEDLDSDGGGDSDGDSDDELNIISAGPRKASKASTSSTNKKLVSEGSLDSTGRNATGVMVDGQFHPWGTDIELLQERSAQLKAMRFKKKSQSTRDTSSNSTLSTPPSTRPSSPRRSSRAGTKAASAPFKPPTSTRPREGNTGSGTGVRSTQQHEQHEQDSAGDGIATPRPTTRPKPRPAYKHSEAQPQRTTRQSRTKAAPFPMDDLSPLKESNRKVSKENTRAHGGRYSDTDSDSPPVKQKANPREFYPKRNLSVKTKQGPRAFPMSPPRKSKLASQDSLLEPPSSPHSSPKSLKRPFPSTAPTASSKSLAPFPLPSPLSSPVRLNGTVDRLEGRTMNHGQGHSKRKAATAGRRKIVISGSDEDSDAEIPRPPPRRNKKPVLQPFPLGTQMLDSISPPVHGGSEAVQAMSSDEDEARDDMRVRGGEEILRELMRSDEMSASDEEMFMDPEVDPSSLCPWCDERLPPTPSPLLQKLIAIARSKSYNDPRLSNPHGLHAPATVFVNVCHRHRFEQHHFPLAQQRGWPTEIEWDRLSERVLRMRPKLQAIVADVDEDFAPGKDRSRKKDSGGEEGDAEDDELIWPRRPRKGSLFWIEVVRSVRKRGSSNAAGVRAQMSNFSKIQPGYYGELGALVLSQTLYDMFPPVHFPPNSTLPLSPADFVQSVLLPEAAVSLIMEDMQLSRKEAILTMRESAQYGVAMFPDDNAEEFSAGEVVVKKRADARRKQLELEETGSVVGGQSSSSRTFGRGPATFSKSTSLLPERRNLSRKATSRNYAESEDEDIRMATDSSLSDTFKAKKPRSKRTTTLTSHKPPFSVVEVSDAPSSSLPTKPRPKPRPRTKHDLDFELEGRDTELEFPTSSDIEFSSHNHPPHASQHQVKVGAKGKVRVSVLSEDDMWKGDADATPRPAKRTRTKDKGKGKGGMSSSKSASDFGRRIKPVTVATASSNKATPYDVDKSP